MTEVKTNIPYEIGVMTQNDMHNSSARDRRWYKWRNKSFPVAVKMLDTSSPDS